MRLWLYTQLALVLLELINFNVLEEQGMQMPQVTLSCFQFSSEALFQRVNVSILCMALENASWAQEDLCHSANPVLWIRFNTDRTFVVMSTGHTSQHFSVMETRFGILRHTVSSAVLPEPHESLVFLSPESWHDKYTFGLWVCLRQITGPHENMGWILSSSCKDKCSAFWLRLRASVRFCLTMGWMHNWERS